MKKIIKTIIILFVLIIGIIIGLNYYNKANNLETLISKTDIYISEILKTNNITKIKDNINGKILGPIGEEYLKCINIQDIGAYINIYNKNAVRIEPFPDPLEIQSYYFKDNKLIMYESESNTIGGIIKYYFKNNKLVKTINDSERTIFENEIDILEKSKNVYEKYLK